MKREEGNCVTSAARPRATSHGARRRGLLLAAAAFLLPAGPGRAQPPVPEVPGELVVQVRSSVSGTRVLELVEAAGAQALAELPRQRLYRIGVPAGAVDAVQSALERRSEVVFAERNRLFEPALVPDDPRFGSQWAHDVVRSSGAWDRTVATGQVVAILDSGVDPSHPDLAGVLLAGWDFYDGDSDPSDEFGHGTKVAGIAAAATDNTEGVASMAWGAAILPVRVSGPDGWASAWTIAEGLDYAATQGASAANLSFAGLAGSSTVLAAAESAVNAGVVVVAGAGNCGCERSWSDTPWLLSVGATTSSDTLASYSTRGDFVDLVAPGSGVETTKPGGGYGSVSGTSYSAPLVAGLVALVRAYEPGLTPAEVEDRIITGVVDLGAEGWDSSYGHGRVDATATLPSSSGSGSSCGLGAELALVMPALMALRRARRASARPGSA